MGFEDRDYYRDPEWEPDRGDRSAVRWLIVLCVGVFVGQLLDARVTEWLALTTGDTVPKWQVWRLLTYAFCHDTKNVLHLLFNMVCLWFFGRPLQERLGNREFVAFYLLAAVAAGLSYLGLHAGLLRDHSLVTGASGATMAVMALFAMWYPRQQVLLFGLFPVEIRWLVAAYVVIDTVPVWAVLQGKPASNGVAHAAHLGGLLFGFAYHIFDWRFSNWLGIRRVPTWWRDRERRKSVRLYSPEADDAESPEGNDLDAKVDDILRKIHEHGESSLSDRERRVLSEASRRYRDRTTRTP